ncbi:MAG: DNA-processing protein DprA [Cryomorphaceae bacterium]|nr:DNA-processing protein DprA [Flavobacteriales bacterium]
MAKIPADKDEIFYQLVLSKVEGVGVISARKLIKHFGTAREVLTLSTRDLMQVQGMSLGRASAIGSFSGFDLIEREMEFAAERGIRLLSFQDPDYPRRLNHCADAPVVLFKRGNADLNASRMVSVVGTRRVTDYGKKVVRQLIESFVPYGITVVSGMAYGVDIEAHKTCLDFDLPTVGVLGHGLDRIYPNSHTRHASAMLEKGALLTEFTTNTEPDRENFPKRNRIVAGMTDATIVVESGFQGGSIITADLANSYNRDVFAIPGRIDDEMSGGCNRLIKSNRAALLESVKDLEYIMGWKASEEKQSVQKKLFVDLNPQEEVLVEFLREREKTQIDELSLGTGMPMSTVMVNLLNLELNGLVRALPGKVYELC